MERRQPLECKVKNEECRVGANQAEGVLKVDADEDGVGGDDAADALRYLVATRARACPAGRLVRLHRAFVRQRGWPSVSSSALFSTAS
jgi:hypothetical protein